MFKSLAEVTQWETSPTAKDGRRPGHSLPLLSCPKDAPFILCRGAKVTGLCSQPAASPQNIDFSE